MAKHYDVNPYHVGPYHFTAEDYDRAMRAGIRSEDRTVWLVTEAETADRQAEQVRRERRAHILAWVRRSPVRRSRDSYPQVDLLPVPTTIEGRSPRLLPAVYVEAIAYMLHCPCCGEALPCTKPAFGNNDGCWPGYALDSLEIGMILTCQWCGQEAVIDGTLHEF